MSHMTPKEITHELDQHIIGQSGAKRSVAIALRNRWRRMQLTEDLRVEVTPKNILMIGPTGVGKTEIARRLAKLANAPFIKVEATKFTEVGYVGRDVESMIRDLAETAVKMARETAKDKVEQRARDAAEERVLDNLLPPARPVASKIGFANEPATAQKPDAATESSARKAFRKKLRAGELDDTEIEIDVKAGSVSMEIMGPPGMEEMTQQLQSMMENVNTGKTKKRKMTIKEALKVMQDDEAQKLINEEETRSNAIRNLEENGIIFIDEIDKIAKNHENQSGGGDVSREGVQRDLLPLIEGSTVNTKYGMIKTDHILFIASGAFHLTKPSDLIPELQGRLPIRVELRALSVEDFERILTEPNASLSEQYVALMATEGLKINFTKNGIKRIAEIAWNTNEKIENIGARRLHTVMERLLDEISFEATDMNGQKVTIDRKYVDKHLGELAKDEDLSRYIL